jgi:hypothetical protein
VEVYTTYLRNGVVTLYGIDLNTGDITRKIALDHLYPQKIQIHSNYVYYLYDDPAQPDNKMLFRQKL